MGAITTRDELVRVFRDAPIPLERVILFGSRARGDHLSDSDWDVLVVSPAFKGMRYIERLAFLYSSLSLRRVEYVVLTPEEWAERREEIGTIGEASREGIILYEFGKT